VTKNDQEDIYSLIGLTLCFIQQVESTLNFVLTYVLQDDEPLTIQNLEQLKRKERKSTLGYFVKKLKMRAELLPALETLLDEFLTNRNDFVHNQKDIPGWDLQTKEGEAVAREFTIKLLLQGKKLLETFYALIIQWDQHVGLNTPFPNEQFVRTIDEQYGWLVDSLFTKKET